MRRHTFTILYSWLIVPCFTPACLAQETKAGLGDAAKIAKNAQAILQTHCYACHGEAGAVEGGMNYILDPARLLARKKVVPGKPDESPIFKRITNGSMPPADIQKRLSDNDIATLRKWILDGAAPATPRQHSSVLAASDVQEKILADLEKIDRRSRRFVRYFTMSHLANAGLGDDELQTYRTALNKLINSLSWHPRIRNPEPIDPLQTIFRIDLRWYMWDATIWNRILVDYPYGILDDSATARAIMVSTRTKVPMIRADWFVATASRAPLYQEILQLPANLADLERQLRVDAGLNIAQERVMRVAFNGSGISKNNRILERHDAVHGYYWRTYDFEDVPQNLIERGLQAPDRRNVFAYPLGPGNLETQFLHAGGEAIFSLPNGLQGYYIMNAANTRLDKAPTAIVSDAKRPDRAVELGVSCMGCHISGIISKADQLHDYLEKNPKAFPRLDHDIAKSLYPTKERSLAQMEDDSKRFRDGLARTGVKVTKTEPIITMTLRYEGDIDGLTAAAEVGLPQEEFMNHVRDSEILSRALGALRVPGGTVHRTVWVQTFADLVRELKLGALFQANQTGAALADNTGELDPLEVTSGVSTAMAFVPDGRKALIASADRSLRLYEVEGRRDLKRLVGHTASLWCVDMLPDASKAISGGMDGTLRYWDLTSFQEIWQRDAHLGLTSAVAISPNGKWALSGGYDGVVVLWDLTSGKETQRWDSLGRYVHALAIAPDGSHAIAGIDRICHVLEFPSGKVIRKLEGHGAAVTALAFSPDGTQLSSGSDDRTARLWDWKSGKLLQTFLGHKGPVLSVAINDSATWLLTGSSDRTVRIWQLSSGTQLGMFSKHGEAVVRVAFLKNGTQTLSGSRDNAILPWNIQKFAPVVPQQKDSSRAGNAAETALEPARKLSLRGPISRLGLTPDGKYLVYLDRGASRIGLIDRLNFQKLAESRIFAGISTFEFAPDGKRLYTIEPSSDGRAGTIFALQLPSLKVIGAIEAPKALRSDQIQVTDKHLFVLDGAEPKAKVLVWDRTQEGFLPSTTELPADVLFFIPPAGQVLFGLSRKERCLYQIKLEVKADLKEQKMPASYAVGGNSRLTLDGRAILDGRGSIFFLPTNASADSKNQLGNLIMHQPFDAFLSSSHAAKAQRIVVITPEGWLKQYDFPRLQPVRADRLRGMPYCLTVDENAEKAYLAVVDPERLATEPSQGGFGEIWEVDLKPNRSTAKR